MAILKDSKRPKGYLRDRLDPYRSTEKAEALLEDTTKEERLAWYQNPCTQALIYGLEGDVAGVLSLWLHGGYSEDTSVDGTAQMQAKARGMAQALFDIREYIDDIRDGSENDTEHTS